MGEKHSDIMSKKADNDRNGRSYTAIKRDFFGGQNLN